MTLFALMVNNVFSQGATCATATTLTVNGTCGGGSTSGTVVSSGSNLTVCGSTVRTDRWYVFTTLNTTGTTTIVATGQNPQSTANRNIAIELLSSCSSASIACANSGTALTETITANLSPLTTYYLRITNVATSVTPVAMSFNNVCVTQPPEFDQPLGAVTLTVGNGVCNYSNFNATSATPSSCSPVPGCGSFSAGTSKDVWFKLVVPASGNFFLQTQSGTMTNAGMAVYSSSICGSAAILGCSDGNPNGVGYTTPPMSMPSLNISGAIPGNTVYVRVWNKTGYSSGTFGICANNMTPCGNLPNNDFCSNPLSITTAGATFTSVATNTTTGITYTDDFPGDLGPATAIGGCVSPLQNSWYSFIATTNDETIGLSIPFALDASTCSGLDLAILQVSKTSDGCCKNFTQLDNCDGSNYDPIADNTFTVTVSPGMLTAGNTYYLMINNYDVVPSACSFSVTGWSVTGILPVEFVSFKANNEGRYNLVEWVTASEKNMTSYTLERSEDAVSFSPVETISANNRDGLIKYEVRDEFPFQTLNYYRLKQKDNYGTDKYSNIISVSLKNMYDNIFNIHPNPTTDNLNFEFYSKSNNTITIGLIGYSGNVVYSSNQALEEGKNNISLPMENLEKGVYILRVISEVSGKTTYHKIIKN